MNIISKNEKYYPLDFDLDLLAKNLTELRLKNKVIVKISNDNNGV